VKNGRLSLEAKVMHVDPVPPVVKVRFSSQGFGAY
jgi:hypothetical protein